MARRDCRYQLLLAALEDRALSLPSERFSGLESLRVRFLLRLFLLLFLRCWDAVVEQKRQVLAQLRIMHRR